MVSLDCRGPVYVLENQELARSLTTRDICPSPDVTRSRVSVACLPVRSSPCVLSVVKWAEPAESLFVGQTLVFNSFYLSFLLRGERK